MITWKDVFEIIKEMFNINQDKIADLMGMGVKKYTISKIKSGKQAPPFSIEDMYQKIFDPNTQESPANDTEKFLLFALEEIIETGFKEVNETMKDCWIEDDKYKAGDYKIFAMRMLERTKCVSSFKDETEISVPNSKKVELQSQPDMDRMLQIFKQTYRECHILEFLGSELFPGIDPKLLFWVERFIKTIKHDILECFQNKKTEQMYINISRYNEALDEYRCYLKENTCLWSRDIDRLVPKNDDYKESVKYYRKRLISLHQEICFGAVLLID